MTHTSVDFSAQFGGEDAAKVLLPHFKILKAAANNITIKAFPYPKLAFILRVDGNVNKYGFSGVGEPDFDKNGEYFSIDIGIEIEDRKKISSVISSAILDSAQIIDAAITHKGVKGFEVNELIPSLKILCANYQAKLKE